MIIFEPFLVTRLIVILGFINLITGTLIFFTCRCFPGSKLGNKLMKHQGYQRFYKYHCHIWKVFWPSVIIHAVMAITVFGWPL
ncbi:MAG: hypothetical protein A2144_05500 [Chloroflexi bacterium RBG_16_50_9]|nr:MAG: hypothetical protein A2144_05500 [Chloroflexi bacterium RBG_16_50_9]